MRTLVAVLAAGGGTRYVGPTHKLLAVVDGVPVVARAVDAVLAAGLGPVVVVQGAVDLADVLGDRDVRLVDSERWADGQATSLQVAIAAARADGADALVVGLGDQLGVLPSAWAAVAGSAGSPIVTASFDGRRLPPVRLGAAVWDLLPVNGDEGARALMRSRPDLVTAVACEGDPHDIDTVEDLDRWS